MKRFKDFSLILLSVFAYLAFTVTAYGQTRDSIVARQATVTVAVSHDSAYIVHEWKNHDSSYTVTVYDTFKVPVPTPVVMLKGMYTHPDNVTIGSATSENSYLSWAKGKGVNMLNCYARSFLYTESKRTQLAAFVAKAKVSYGIILTTVDVRFTNSAEEQGWIIYMGKYAGTPSMIEPLTEFEPWIKNSSGVYDYANFFYLVRTMGNLCKKYNVKLNFYEGWIGNNYNGLAFSQAPVDSMVKYCDRIFISNYVTVSDYNSASSSLGKWDNRMDKRCSPLAIACPKFGKVSLDIVEIHSLESVFLGSVYTTHSFYGSTYTDAVNAYNLSTPAVLQYTDLVGKTIFQSVTAKTIQP